MFSRRKFLSALLLLSGAACTAAITSSGTENDSGVISVRTQLLPGVPDVSHIPPGITVAEPAVVADPERPDNVVAAAMVEHRTARDSAGKYTQNHRAHAWVRLWRSNNGGQTWDDGTDLLPDFSGLVADFKGMSGKELSVGDVAMGVQADGRVITAVDVTDWFAGRDKVTFDTGSGPFEGFYVTTQDSPGGAFSSGVRLDLSDIPEVNSYAHVPALIVDRWKSSPYVGRIYLTYLGQFGPAKARQQAIFLKISTDGGKSFSRAREVPGTRGFLPYPDAAVSPDGALHFVWTMDSTKLRYSISRDGGTTFSEGARVPTHPATVEQWAQMTIGERGANKGKVLLAMEQAFGARNPKESRPTTASVMDVSVTVLGKDGTFAIPQRLDPSLPAERQFRLPSPAITDNAMWMLVYRDNTTGVDVVLYRSVDNGRTWREAQVLGSRNVQKFYPGHFSSLWAAGNRLYASYALPTEDPKRPVGLYVSVIEVR
jgi:hypothetical protein